MNSEQQEHLGLLEPGPGLENHERCGIGEEGHCLTCSDEALPARVLGINQATGQALVALQDTEVVEVDVSLVEGVAPGDWLLVHGGVAVTCLGEAGNGANGRL